MNIFNNYPKYEEVGDDGEPSGGAPNDPPADPPSDPPANYFASVPDTWRTDFASNAGYEGEESTKITGMLDRYSDPAAFLKSAVSAQDMISKGELSNGLPDNPTEDQLNNWREANGVPLESNYDVVFDDGNSLSTANMEMLKGSFEAAHANNLSSSGMNEMANSFAVSVQAVEEKMTAQDGIDSQQGIEVLKEAWKGNYETNMNMVNGLLNQLPEAVREQFVGSRMADGKGMMNSPEVLEFFSGMARKLNPAGTVVPNSSNPVQSVRDELATLKARMGTDEWFKDQPAQDRYQQLLEAQANMSK